MLRKPYAEPSLLELLRGRVSNRQSLGMKKCDGDNAIVLKSKQIAIRIIRLYQFLNNSKHEYVISKQLLRSGTSIGANVSEATCAFSKKDFLSKMYIAFKESAETLYWIELLHDTDYLNETQFQSIYNDCLSIKSLLSSITKSTAEAINS